MREIVLYTDKKQEHRAIEKARMHSGKPVILPSLVVDR